MSSSSKHNNKGWLFVAALVSVTLLGPLAIHMYLPIMPYVQDSFGTSSGLAQLSLSLVLLVMAAGTLVYGSLSDRFGRKRVLLGGLLLFGVGSVYCALAPSVTSLLAGRLLQAAGAGCGIVMARAIARDVYGTDKLAQVIAYITVAYVLGPMFAPPIGGALADIWGWRTVFALAVAVCAAVFLLIAAVLKETHSPLPASQRTRMSTGYVRLLRSPVFMAYAINPGLTSGAFFALASASALLMADVFQRSASEYGLYFILLPIGYMSGNFVSGRIGNRAPTDTMVILGNFVALAATLLLALVLFLGAHHPIWMFVGGMLISCGQGLSMPYAQAAAINVDRELTGTASGIVVFLHFFGSAVTIQLVGAFYDKTFVPVLVIVFAASLLALISAFAARICARRARPVTSTASVP